MLLWSQPVSLPLALWFAAIRRVKRVQQRFERGGRERHIKHRLHLLTAQMGQPCGETLR